MNCPELTQLSFIAQFPEFAQTDNIELMIGRALNYIRPYSCFCGDERVYIIFLLTAHLLSQQNAIAQGDSTGGIQTGASIDRVSVSIAPPPFSNGWEYWLNQSKYGQELLALFQLKIATPGYVGGSFTRVL
jgi:hypothetical protein